MKRFTLEVFDVFECYEVFVSLIGVVYALVMVIYFCIHDLEKYESEIF